MNKAKLQLDRRHDTKRRVAYAFRAAQAPMFDILANPGTEKMPKDPRAETPRKSRRVS
jgi:hypothetical protein